MLSTGRKRRQTLNTAIINTCRQFPDDMKFEKFLLLLGIGLVFLAGCATQPRVVIVHEPNPEQPPTHIPLQSEANVFFIPGQTKAYTHSHGTSVRSNPKIMHERHVIYRREEDDRWRLYFRCATAANPDGNPGKRFTAGARSRRLPSLRELPDLPQEKSAGSSGIKYHSAGAKRRTL